MSVAKRQILEDAIGVGFVHDRSFAEPAAAFRAFAGEQMASAGVGAQHFAGGSDFETFGDGFLCFDAFGATHKVNFRSKRAGNIGTGLHRRKRYFSLTRDGGTNLIGSVVSILYLTGNNFRLGGLTNLTTPH